MGKSKRTPKGKKINPTYFVFCEGKSEENYINYLRSKYRIPIVIDSKIAGSSISDKYIRSYKRGKFTHEKDRNFLVYDLDKHDLIPRLKQIQTADLIGSNPCFELWYLLHYQEQNASINCSECCRRLIKKNSTYCKGSIDRALSTILDTKQEKAINRAKKLGEGRNPSSSIYRLIEELEIAKRNK